MNPNEARPLTPGAIESPPLTPAQSEARTVAQPQPANPEVIAQPAAPVTSSRTQEGLSQQVATAPAEVSLPVIPDITEPSEDGKSSTMEMHADKGDFKSLEELVG